jgi:hypothetical protein
MIAAATSCGLSNLLSVSPSCCAAANNNAGAPNKHADHLLLDHDFGL